MFNYIQIMIAVNIMVEGAGFEPAKAVPTDLQSAPFSHLGIPPYIRLSGADDGTRTRNLLITSQLLCQLSYVGSVQHALTIIQASIEMSRNGQAKTGA
jgi:hypothetical protein